MVDVFSKFYPFGNYSITPFLSVSLAIVSWRKIVRSYMSVGKVNESDVEYSRDCNL